MKVDAASRRVIICLCHGSGVAAIGGADAASTLAHYFRNRRMKC
jgi:hypothetical protein